MGTWGESNIKWWYEPVSSTGCYVANIHGLSGITGDVCKSEDDIDDDFDIEDIGVD